VSLSSRCDAERCIACAALAPLNRNDLWIRLLLSPETLDPLAGCVTLREIAPRIGSYFTAYSLAAAGRFGPPVAVIGRTQLFRRAAVDRAVEQHLAARAARRKQTGTLDESRS